jgi:hypothetical protein
MERQPAKQRGGFRRSEIASVEQTFALIEFMVSL